MEAPYEAFAVYVFRTPLYPLGMVLLANLKLLTGIKALSVSGTDLIIAYLAIILVYRRATHSRIDGKLVPTARPMVWGAMFSIGTALFIWGRGLLTGGDFANSLWQVQKVLYIPIFFLLFQACIRGPKDLGALAKVFIWGAVYRALLALYIFIFVRPDGLALPFCTTHADSMLFVDVLALMVVLFNERVHRKQRWLYVLVMAIVAIGMVVNNRRLAWVTFTGALVAIAAISPWTSLKRRIARALLVLAPLLFLYVSAGWNSQAGIFKPAQIVRSIVDSKSDSSSQWRDMENQNLQTNITMHPWFGVGYGHEYIEFTKLPDVSASYPQFRYIPHNSVLATWAFAGVFGFTGLWTMLVVLIFLAVRSYHRTAIPSERAAAMICVVAVIAYMNQVYGDIGVSEWLGPMILSPVMVVAAKLATSTGAWPSSAWRPATSEPPEAPRQGPAATVIPLDPVVLTLNEPGDS